MSQIIIYISLPSIKMILEKQEETLRQGRIWLGGIERDLEFERNRKLHTIGTCEWILDNKLFKSWVAGDVKILLINGIPGKPTFLFSHLFYIRAASNFSFFC